MFSEAPQFITDDNGNKIKVILNIDDFYDLLAAADREMPKSNGKPTEATVTPATIAVEAHPEDADNSPDAIFKRAFDLIKQSSK